MASERFDFDAYREQQLAASTEDQPPALAPPTLVSVAKTLQELNLESELLEQYAKVKELQDHVMHDPEIPANQKAQVANSVASTIKMLVESQEKYYSQERFKRIEATLVRVMKTWPPEQAEAFLVEYEKAFAA